MSKQIAVLFPGQGSQYEGMSKVLLEQFPWTKQIFEEASDATNENILKLCEEGPADKLQLTEHAQPCILTTSYTWFQVLRRELDLKPMVGAGHSLGELTALLAAGAMTLPEAAHLVKKRGQAMQQAVPVGRGKMAALLGLDNEKVEALCETASEPGSLVVPANYNAPGQVVVAGHAAAVDRAELLAKEGEFKARKFIPLKVSAPFHSPLMAEMAKAFVSELSKVNWQPLRFPIAFNVDAQIRSESTKYVELLRDQIDHPVRWSQCAAALEKHGADLYIEMGPGKVLTGLVKRTVENGKIHSLDSYEEFKELEKIFKETL